ncbi:MAG: dienelactone hydrolase family protein [Alphaproteobacteria bacterium]|nr:dienelactone hydrolase family protein [Alphaproteobacteria bacterium]
MGSSAAAEEDVVARTLAYQGRERSYFLDIPAAAKDPAPLIVLLHGVGGNGRFMAERWRDVAARQGIVLLAPQALHSERGWDPRIEGPDFIHALILDVAARHPIDFRRLYVFGHSGGAVYALTLAMVESEYFAAAGIYAGSWRTAGEYRVAAYATRKIPVGMWVGDQDVFFSLNSVRQTQRVLRDEGIPAELTILDGRRHDYGDAPKDFHDQVWRFLSAHALDGPPRYAEYK